LERVSDSALFRAMAKVVHLPTERGLPDTVSWVRIRRSDGGKYQVQVCKGASAKAVLTYDIDLDTFAAAIWRAKQHADAIQVPTVYAIGCDAGR
jgi:hypothetical protein